MDLELVLMLIGFALASYSVIGNDAIQTLGTFLSSNSRRPWWVLWLYASGILTCVLIYGYVTSGDVSHGRLDSVPIPAKFEWYFIIPPLILLVVTRFGIPVSTTFLILSVFAVASSGEPMPLEEVLSSIVSSDQLIGKMLIKSGTGYILAFVVTIIIYLIISKIVEKYFIETHTGQIPSLPWVVAQWISTGFLWSMWLIQDMANIYVYLPRDLSPNLFIISVFTFVGLQGILFYNRGGEIQKIVTSKTNTTDIRSATIVDFIYGIILFYFKIYSKVPMSTTWVFVGLLAGREIAINLLLTPRPMKTVLRIILLDFGKIVIGLLISVALVLLITQLVYLQS